MINYKIDVVFIFNCAKIRVFLHTAKEIEKKISKLFISAIK